MCGLIGLFSNTPNTADFYSGVIAGMSASMAHRGPDGSGKWVDEQDGVALGHRRLAVVDLSEHGAQPMVSHSGRFVLSYNGEIYNHNEIRAELESHGPHHFSGTSDTETLLASVEAWGVTETLKRLNGMFAFALWDRREKSLVLARDRLGIKPLFYGVVEGALVFSSELRAFHHYPGFNGHIDRNALDELIRYTAIGAPRTIYQQVRKLEPGGYISVTAAALVSQELPAVEHYWHLKDVAMRGCQSPLNCGESELVDELDGLLRSSIKAQMLSDVPIGSFLSGGIDSSTVVALMQSESIQPVKTFTIGFREDAYDEARYARQIARHLGTDHHELYLTIDDAQRLVPQLADICDEPFGDSSILPTFLVSKLARETVTVSLSGDGGDELFGGYNRYVAGGAMWRRTRKVPHALAAVLRSSIYCASPAVLNSIAGTLEKVVPGVRLPRAPADKLYKIADILGVKDADAFYDLILSRWSRQKSLVLGLDGAIDLKRISSDSMGLVNGMMLKDQAGYLPDDILAKVDRASMAVSLESRVPLLDHRLVEFAWRVPLSQKIKQGQGKLPLRKLLDRYIPRELLDRPKVGFGLPIHEWLQGGLRDWAESLLDPVRLRDEDFFDVDQVQSLWREQLSGRYNRQHLIWNILSFQAWNEKRVSK